MRLTLRTLLAYLDNAIEPSEAEGLAKKIEESEFASALVQRLRSVIHKPRLPAPKVDGKGLGMDPNSVAEYIESTLPAERVNEFERLCIESDMHLAEVAATHQILSLVLGRPSKVSQELRERIYAIQTQKPASEGGPAEDRKRWTPDLEEEPVVASLKGQLSTGDDDDEETLREVPEYLKASKSAERNWRALALTVAVGFLLTAVVLRAMGPFDGSHPLARMLGSRPEPIAEIPPLPEQPPVEPEPSPVPAPKPSVDPAPQPMPEVPVEPAVPEPVKPAPMDPMPPEPQPESPLPMPAVPVEPKPMPTDPSPMPMPTEVASIPPIEPVPMPNPMPEPILKVDVGRFISDEQVLAHFDPKSGLWSRVPPKSLLMSGEQMVALPVFRPLVALPSGVQVTILGETHFQMLPPGQLGAPRLKIEQGRVSVITDGVPGGKLGLILAGKELLVTLNDADSLVAVHVRRYQPPGSDPQVDPDVSVIEVIAVNGHADVEVVGSDAIELRPQHVMTIIGEKDAEVSGPFQPPAWVDVRGERDIDREAARALEKELQGERTLPVALTEGLQDRRVEVRSLAARALAHLGEFSGIMDELSDARQATFWNADLDTLKTLLASDPDTAARMQQAVDRRFGMHSATLYRMLWGYSPEQLAAGSGADLVKALELPEIELRVVAAYTLERITGTSHAYRASGRPETNRPAITRFKERLADGELTYKVAPSPKSEFKPLPVAAP